MLLKCLYVCARGFSASASVYFSVTLSVFARVRMRQRVVLGELLPSPSCNDSLSLSLFLSLILSLAHAARLSAWGWVSVVRMARLRVMVGETSHPVHTRCVCATYAKHSVSMTSACREWAIHNKRGTDI